MRLLIILSILGGVFYYVQSENYFGLLGSDGVSQNGFVELPELTNIHTDSVIIFAPENCPKEGARRAEVLADKLERNNIPVMQASNAKFGQVDVSMRSRLDRVMRGTLPIVLVGGWGKANPTYEEVVSEYNLAYE